MYNISKVHALRDYLAQPAYLIFVVLVTVSVSVRAVCVEIDNTVVVMTRVSAGCVLTTVFVLGIQYPPGPLMN